MIKVTVKEDLSLECSDPSLKPGVYELKAIDNTQSGRQRRYYWKCLVKPVADYTGNSQDETHGKFAEMFLRIVPERGVPHTPSTEKLSTKAREVYHEDIRRWASSFLGVYLEEPNERDMY